VSVGGDLKSRCTYLSSEFRKGQMCSRCLRNVDRSSDDVAEEDDSSILDNLITPPPHRSSFSLDVQVRPEIVRALGFLSLSQCFF
jgi:hypothetical protein